jgi:hypothetical protein
MAKSFSHLAPRTQESRVRKALTAGVEREAGAITIWLEEPESELEAVATVLEAVTRKQEEELAPKPEPTTTTPATTTTKPEENGTAKRGRKLRFEAIAPYLKRARAQDPKKWTTKALHTHYGQFVEGGMSDQAAWDILFAPRYAHIKAAPKNVSEPTGIIT